MQIKLGCDPEIFLVDSLGVLRASCGKIGGTKQHPAPLPIGEGYCVQEDNVALEFNIPPASNAKEFVDSIRKTMTFLGEGIMGAYGYSLSPLSAASFPEEELESDAAKQFGCDPDFNIWTNRANPRPKADDPNLRSCGGHVHIGFDRRKVNPSRVIKAMDLFLGVPSVLMDNGVLRRKLYGKAGAYRDKPYGAEYRTLSNWWVHDDRLIQWVWDNTQKAVDAAESQFALDDYQNSILDAIDNNNHEAAKSLVTQCNLEVLSV